MGHTNIIKYDKRPFSSIEEHDNAIMIDKKRRVLSTGYNGFPAEFNDDLEERHKRPKKYFYAEHAERNAIYNSARSGVSIENAIIYVIMFPCADCARAIIQSGIKRVVTPPPIFNRVEWKESFEVSIEMVNECGVEIEFVDLA